MAKRKPKPEPARIVRIPAPVHSLLLQHKAATGVPLGRTVADALLAHIGPRGAR